MVSIHPQYLTVSCKKFLDEPLLSSNVPEMNPLQFYVSMGPLMECSATACFLLQQTNVEHTGIEVSPVTSLRAEVAIVRGLVSLFSEPGKGVRTAVHHGDQF